MLSQIVTFGMFTYVCSAQIRENTISEHVMQDRVCKTSGCFETARLISENMDKTIHPCDNFYRFACGNYIKESYIQQDKVSASVIGTADDRLKQQLKESIREKIDETDSRTLRLLKSHYNICLDIDNIEQTGMKILLDILNDLGGWPVLIGESWDESAFDWKHLIYQLRRIGYKNSMHAFLSFTVETDEKNNTNYVIGLDQAQTGLLSEYLVKGVENEVVQAYYKYMVNTARALGVDVRHAKKELAGSLLFEIELAKISLPTEERRNISQLYNPMTIEELQLKYPDVPWSEYINQFLRPHYTIESTERIIVRDSNFFKFVAELLYKTPKRVLANYAIWRVVKESASYLNKLLRHAQTEFIRSSTGVEVQQPRWAECIDHVTENIPLAVGALYVRKDFDKNLKKEGMELVEELRRSFKNSLEKIDWMDKKTKVTALKKLKSIYAHVAYPDEFLDDKKLDKYFENLKVKPDSCLDSYLSLSLFDMDDTYQQLGKSYNKTDWVTHGTSAVVNAYYQFSENSLQIPAGFFQKELFATDKPNYMNYGGIGYFIGHEFTHAFDDEGSQFDENGNLVNWWDSKTQKEYQKRAQCIEYQYSNYTVAEVGININGVNTLGENIADNGGVKQAYFAYEDYEKRNGPEPRLPGLPYTPRQLFWLSIANVYCEKFRPEALKYDLTSEEHCPGEFRVIGAFVNMPEFSRDFECPLGSFMNPVTKCTFW